MEAMRTLGRFTRDKSGSMVPSYAGITAIVALASVFATWGLDRMTRGRADETRLDIMAARSLQKNGPHSVLSQTTVDYTPTGSIPASLAAPVVLDPCTGARKN